MLRFLMRHRPGIVAAAGAAAVAGVLLVDARSPVYPAAVMPAVRALLDAEGAHQWAMWLAAHRIAPVELPAWSWSTSSAAGRGLAASDAALLHTRVFGRDLLSPVGLAAGFDKHAEAIDGLLAMGFGLVEIGSVTPRPQPGNPRPRMFRLVRDRAVINRYGFNSDGQDAVAQRLAVYRAAHTADRPPRGLVGVNLGKNKEQTDAAADYVAGVRALGPYADYLVVNVSSPNTPGLRSLQGRAQLSALITQVLAARDALPNRPPLLVKIAPDLTDDDMEDIAAVALERRIDGLIVSNTTLSRPATLQSPPELVAETGGLSGAPLRELSTWVLGRMYQLTRGEITLIGVGGVASGRDAFDKILHGASLVQVYTAFTYDGPGVAARIKSELAQLLRAHGYASVQEAVGKGVENTGTVSRSTIGG